LVRSGLALAGRGLRCGVSLLITESNRATATRTADRLYAIDRGEIIFEGDPGAALASPTPRVPSSKA